jgi:HSP20 family molecular chaperone IbpA
MTVMATNTRAACNRTSGIARISEGYKSVAETRATTADCQLASFKSPALASITETESQFRILLPLDGIDAQYVSMFATPQAVLVEVRIKNAITHCSANCQEIQQERFTRKIKLHNPIKKGATTVRLLGNNLEINCTKATDSGKKGWSELLHLDTRSSLGCS